MDLHKPHDTFFSAYFGNTTMLLHLLHFTLPEEVFSLLDTDSLIIKDGTYIDKDYHKQYSDIDVSVTLQGKPAKIYILVEHKSYYNSKTLLQMLRYITQIWSRDAKNTPSAPLTPIIPILFYHGEREETESRFIELLPVDLSPELKQYQPDFAVNLFNLTALRDDLIEGPPEFTAALWALKYTRSQIDKVLRAWENLVKTTGDVLTKYPGFDYLKMYLLAASDKKPEEIIEMVDSIIQISFLKEKIMSTAEMLIEQGIEQGIERGKKEGRQEEMRIIVKKMKDKAFPVDEISDITGLSKEEIEAL